MDESIKPGWKTSEFWMPLISLFVTLAVSLNYIPPHDAPTVMGYVSALVVGAIGLGGNVVLALNYIKSRIAAKKAAALLKQTMAEALAGGEKVGVGQPPTGKP